MHNIMFIINIGLRFIIKYIFKSLKSSYFHSILSQVLKLNKLSQALFLSGALLLAKTGAFAMMEEENSQFSIGNTIHSQSHHHMNTHTSMQDRKPTFREDHHDFSSQNNPSKIASSLQKLSHDQTYESIEKSETHSSSKLTKEEWISLSTYIYEFLGNLTRPVEVEKNPSGFFRINNIPLPQTFLNIVGPHYKKLRVHYWPLDQSNEIAVETIHDHPNVFETFIVRGGYQHETFTAVPCMEGIEQYQITRIQKPHNTYIQMNNTLCLLSDKGTDVFSGEAQLFPITFIHRVLKYIPGTISMNLVHNDDTNRGEYFHLYSREPLSSNEIKEKLYISPEQSRQVVCTIKDVLGHNDLANTSPAMHFQTCSTQQLTSLTVKENDQDKPATSIENPALRALGSTAISSAFQGSLVSFSTELSQDILLEAGFTYSTASYATSVVNFGLAYMSSSYVPTITGSLARYALKYANMPSETSIVVGGMVSIGTSFIVNSSNIFSLNELAGLGVTMASNYVGSRVGIYLEKYLFKKIKQLKNRNINNHHSNN